MTGKELRKHIREHLTGDLQAAFSSIGKGEYGLYLYVYVDSPSREVCFCYAEQPLLWQNELLFTPTDLRDHIKDFPFADGEDTTDFGEETAKALTASFLKKASTLLYVERRIAELEREEHRPDSPDGV